MTTEIKTEFKESNNFTKLAEAYSKSKSSKDFDKLYKEIRIIAMSASKGLTVDSHDYETIVNDVSMKLYENFDKYYDENKSLLSFVFISCKRKYYSLKKKYNKSICESDMTVINDEDGNEVSSKFTKALTDYYGTSLNQEEFELESSNKLLHMSTDKMVIRIKEILKELSHDANGKFDDEQYRMYLDIFTLRNCEFSFSSDKNIEELKVLINNHEVGSVSEFISPNVIASKYRITNRTTISAKRTRALEKIRTTLKNDIEESKKLEFSNYSGTRTITKEINNKIYLHTYEIVDGIADGRYTKEIVSNNTKILLADGRYTDGKKSGIWTYYFNSGSLMGYIDFTKNAKSFEYINETNECDTSSISMVLN
jgi:DNA-directed RNA polymerase specialized sigma24 family protein